MQSQPGDQTILDWANQNVPMGVIVLGGALTRRSQGKAVVKSADALSQKMCALEQLDRYAIAVNTSAEAKSPGREAAAPPPKSEPNPEPKPRCPTCRSDRVALESGPELYELRRESCAHSEIFDVMSPYRESDSHWFG